MTTDPKAPLDCEHPNEAEAIPAELSSQEDIKNTIELTPPAFFLWFFLGMFFFALYLLYIVFQPFLHSLILACVFTAISYPLYLRFLKFTKNRPMFASLMVLTCLTILVVVPIVFFIRGLIPQAGASVSAINSWLVGAQSGEVFNQYLNPILLWIHEIFPEFDLVEVDIQGSIREYSREAGQILLGIGKYLLSNTVRFIIHFVLILLIMFFLLMDGANLVNKLKYYYPLRPQQTGILIESSRRIARSVLVGGFAVAALQGIIGGIGLAIVGLPAFFWGTVMCFAALVPVVGTGLVWVPAVLLLLLQDQMGYAIFLSLWCGIGVTSIDSILRPLLVKGGANVPLLFIFLSILGGINVFGMIGLLYGPMILSFVATMLDLYGEEYRNFLQARNNENNQR